MKVLIAGFCKTGTKSVETALSILGYKVADYAILNFKHFDVWENYMKGKGCLDDLRYMYDGLDVASDMPALMYWEDFLKAFPDLKIIMMTRPEDDWLRSWNKHWDARNSGELSMPLAIFSPTARKYIKLIQMEGYTFYQAPPQSFRKMYKGIPDDVFKKVFREHNRRVIENAPPDRLCVLDLKEGWGPLCKFLGLPEPDRVFPHRNKDAGLLQEQHANNPVFRQMYFEMYIAWAVIAIMLSFIAFILLRMC